MKCSKAKNTYSLNKPDQSMKLIRINDVTKLTGLSKSYIYHLCDKGLFPKRLHIIPGGTSVAWVEAEVLAWIKSRIQARDGVSEVSNATR